MPIFYHRTHKHNAASILREGIRCGSEVNQGEALPFVMATIDKYPLSTGHMAVFAFEIDDDDPKLFQVNRDWIEYHANVPVSALCAIGYPPSTNEEVIALAEACEWDLNDPRYTRVFRYHTIERDMEMYAAKLIHSIEQGE